MNLRILAALLIYWGMWAMVFSLGASALFPAQNSFNYTSVFNNQSGASGNEITTGGIFGSGLSFGRFLTLTFFGLGLPADSPSWASILIGIVQSCITIFGVGWFISSIWNGG